MANNIDPDEMAHRELSHLDLHCLHSYLFLFCKAERVNLAEKADKIYVRNGIH